MKTTQYDRLAQLLQRKRGATPLELMQATGSTCVHKRMSEMKARGWTIQRQQIDGRSFERYHGIPPKG